MIAVLVSSYREGPPLLSTIRSALVAGDLVLVDDSPIGAASESGDPSPLDVVGKMGSVLVRAQKGGPPYESDAAKRSSMLAWAKEVNNRRRAEDDPLWIVWLDGDELLLYGEYLRDWIYRADFELDGTAGGGFPLRLVELDGSVSFCYGKLIRADAVARYLHSSYQVELVNGMVVALPNVKVCNAGGIPTFYGELSAEEAQEAMAYHRPPLHGEPHILHRSLLRSPERTVERQSDAESRWFSEILGPDGETLKEIPR